MHYQTESFGLSDLGLAREINEDVFHAIPKHHFFLLADGMGGHNAGEIAAKEAVHHLSTSVCQYLAQVESFCAMKMLHASIIKANHWVHQLSEQREDLYGMGTTLCCLLLHDNHFICAHVGDSRLYRFRETLEQITQDHRSSISIPSRKHLITRAIGIHPHVEPDITSLPITDQDIYLLCSDGLTDYVSDEVIFSILQSHSSLQNASHALVQRAKQHGGKDNITVLMVKVSHAS